ncbi:MAG: hypothetical protein AMJ68_04660 [Acidithiobacillales bacterium SG8_45]|jgi:hypothetical protein|nr:MAG: hypothetical protein AMJ68_04660 [Acidithiobacillales bacterium SG8_45]
MTKIPVFTDDKTKIVQKSINGRYGKEIELRLANAEIPADPSVHDLIEIPAFFRTGRGTQFVTTALQAQAGQETRKDH